jgi:hypothetical protein
MSEIKVDNLTGKTSAGNITVTSEGGAATQSLQQGLAKAWCFFDGTAGTIAFADSFNGSSLSDVSTGQYDMNFSSSMSNITYPASFSGNDRNDNRATSPQSSSACRMLNRMGIDGFSATDNDDSKCQFSLHGDLA